MVESLRSVVLNRQNTLFDVRCWTFDVRRWTHLSFFSLIRLSFFGRRPRSYETTF
ncbi:hypothetical protein D1AOALGA4SA_428 [Olavius algarvensis Delta 1 endosymbiont]|nr:hypothetical protein D1AOALGA4SA_428 [Olavius algarvensis Delta 1 endosymbiont]